MAGRAGAGKPAETRGPRADSTARGPPERAGSPTGPERSLSMAHRGARVNRRDADNKVERRWVFARIWVSAAVVVIRFGCRSVADFRRARADLAAIVAPQILHYDYDRAEFILPAAHAAEVEAWARWHFPPAAVRVWRVPAPAEVEG